MAVVQQVARGGAALNMDDVWLSAIPGLATSKINLSYKERLETLTDQPRPNPPDADPATPKPPLSPTQPEDQAEPSTTDTKDLKPEPHLDLENVDPPLLPVAQRAGHGLDSSD